MAQAMCLVIDALRLKWQHYEFLEVQKMPDT